MLFHKKKTYPQHKELKIIRLDLLNYIICLNKKNAEIYNDKCPKLGLNILTLEEAFPKLINLYDLKHKGYENEDDSNYSSNDCKKYYYLRERNKKDKKKLNFENNDSDKTLNKKRKNYKKKKNNNDTNYIIKNSEEYYNSNRIRKEDLFKMFKSLDNKINRKKDKKYTIDKVQMSLEEKKALMNEIRKRFSNLSLTQIKEIKQKFFNDYDNNEKGEIYLELSKLSQEELKRLNFYIQDYEKNNSLDPDFINYKEEIKRRNLENKNEIVNDIHIFTFENNNNHNIDMSDSDDDDDDDDDNLSDESNQNKMNSNIQEDKNKLNNENLSKENINNNNILNPNEVNNSDIFENYSNLSED